MKRFNVTSVADDASCPFRDREIDPIKDEYWWPFRVGVICLVNSVDERDLSVEVTEAYCRGLSFPRWSIEMSSTVSSFTVASSGWPLSLVCLKLMILYHPCSVQAENLFSVRVRCSVTSDGVAATSVWFRTTVEWKADNHVRRRNDTALRVMCRCIEAAGSMWTEAVSQGWSSDFAKLVREWLCAIDGKA